MRRRVAGVDWAGGAWFGVVFEHREYSHGSSASEFRRMWGHLDDLDRMVIDVPIGLPDNEETLQRREELDSLARSVTGRSSSVFPVPSRKARAVAREGGEYEEVALENRNQIEKGLTKQSYHIAEAIGQVDEFLQTNEQFTERVIESHPEVCFRGLLGRKLDFKKSSAAGVGERLEALENSLDSPGSVLDAICRDCVDQSEAVAIDDVIDAVVLAVVGSKDRDEILYLPESPGADSTDLPIRMAYWSENSVL